MSELSISFLGATGTVTGSRYLLDDGVVRVLIDCGLFQGGKVLRERNWATPGAEVTGSDVLILTHAHIDHSGYIPRLVRQGWRGRIITTEATADLCRLLLPDSGHLQEKDAQFANRRGFSKHRPALPLYTAEDARASLEYFSPCPFHQRIPIADGVDVTFHRAGHILGAAFVELHWKGTTLVFSGDLGRSGDPVMLDPEPPIAADFLVVESTYGDRLHDRVDPEDALGESIERCVQRGGTVVIPAFAVGRAQSLLYLLSKLRAKGRLPKVPVYLDSPMAIDASHIFCDHVGDHRLQPEDCEAACGIARYVREVAESKELTADTAPKIIISASGMATGGRVLHHLKHYAPDPRNLILFAGFQAAGTRGAAIVAGAEEVKIHGEYVPIRAEVANLSMLSAHADADEIMNWLQRFPRPPRRTFVTHGEPGASSTLRDRIEQELRWPSVVPVHGERVALK